MASKIREVFLGEKGLTGAIRKLPLETVFELKNVKQVCAGCGVRVDERACAAPCPRSGACARPYA